MASVIDYVSLKPGDFLSDDDFQVWDAALCGAYCRIIFYLYKNNGRVKNDQDHLRGLANWQGPNWDEAWTKLFPKFRVRGNNLIHKRVADELRRAKKRMQDKSAAGRKGADVRWQKHGNRNASAMPSNVMVREENNNPPTPQIEDVFPQRQEGVVQSKLPLTEEARLAIVHQQVFGSPLKRTGLSEKWRTFYADLHVREGVECLSGVTADVLRAAKAWADKQRLTWAPGTFQLWLDSGEAQKVSAKLPQAKQYATEDYVLMDEFQKAVGYPENHRIARAEHGNDLLAAARAWKEKQTCHTGT